MPNNIRQLKQELKKEAGTKTRAEVHDLVLTLLLKNLAKFTNVDTGRLAGNWVVSTTPGGGRFNPAQFNVTRQPNAQALVALEVVDGKKTFYIINKTPYASYINDGTKKIRPFRFVERAILQTNVELRKRKIVVQRIA